MTADQNDHENIDDGQLPLFELETPTAEAPSPTEAHESLFQRAVAELPPSPFSKYIVYVDESGDHSLQSIDNNYPVFVLAFCVFHKRHYSEQVFQHSKNSSLITLDMIRSFCTNRRFARKEAPSIFFAAKSSESSLWMS